MGQLDTHTDIDPFDLPSSALEEGLTQRFGAVWARGMAGHEAPDRLRRGRGAASNTSGRFEPLARGSIEEGDEALPLRTEVTEEQARSIISRNDSPDLRFDRSVNVYRGCEHGCFYCFARPSHAYLGLSPGLDFETKLFAKTNAAELLDKELRKPGYKARPLALGANTDPYQPIERGYGLTRAVLEVLERHSHPVLIVTKNHLVTRDQDILERMAARDLVKVTLSVTTLDRSLARAMEPRASTPEKRLEAMRLLSEAGIPVGVLMAPVIPGLNDHEIERVLEAARAQGASEAGYVMLRLPHELKQAAREWLVAHRPDAARRVMNLVRDLHGGQDYQSAFGQRQKGQGPLAWMYQRRFALALKRYGFRGQRLPLRTDLFQAPAGSEGMPEQLSLFP